MNRPENLFYSNKDLRDLFIPLLIEQALAFGVGLADSMMVAQVGENAVSGVSLVDFVMALLISVFAALAGGGGVVVGQYLGMKAVDRANHSAAQMTKFSFFFSLAVMAAVYALREFILGRLFGSITPEVRAAADVYFFIVVASIPFLALYNCGAAVFRTMGNSRLPMRVMLLMNLLNVAGNALLVFVFRMGVAGIAIPTLISRFGAAAVVLFLARKKALPLHLRGWLFAPADFAMMKKILHIGAPFGFENGMFFLGRLIVLTIVSRFGTAAIAANSVAGTIGTFQSLPGMAINLGLSVVIARCIGANDEAQARWYAVRILRLLHGMFVISCTAVIAAMPPLMRIYNLSPEATRMAWIIVVTHGVFQVFMWPEGFSLPAIFRGAGDARYPMIVAITVMIFARIIAAYILSVTFGLGMLGTWYAMYIDWVFRVLFFVPRYRRGTWLKFRAV